MISWVNTLNIPHIAAQVAEILRESYGWLPDFVRWPARKRQAKLVGLSYVLTHVLE